MRYRNSPRRESGFTLIEMMVAVAILGVVLLMLADAFHTVAMSKVQGEEHLGIDREGRAIMWQLSNELRDAVQTSVYPSRVLLIGRSRQRDGEAVDSLSLSTFAAGHTRAIYGAGAEQVVTYALEPNPNHQGWFILTRQQQSGLLTQTSGQKSSPALMMADNLVSLDFRFYNGSKWVQNWDSTALPHGRQLPLAVAIGLELAGPKGQKMNFDTAVDVPMAQTLW